MLIAIAGSIGAGKSTVARAVSNRLGIPVHSIDDDKRAVGESHQDFARWVRDGIPFPDDFRELAFARTLDQLAGLAATHRHVIVEETFHRKSVRDSFFYEASRLLGGLLLIAITVDRDIALAHLAQRSLDDEGHMAGQAMFTAFHKIADPLENVDLYVANNGDLAEPVNEVCAFLEERL